MPFRTKAVIQFVVHNFHGQFFTDRDDDHMIFSSVVGGHHMEAGVYEHDE